MGKNKLTTCRHAFPYPSKNGIMAVCSHIRESKGPANQKVTEDICEACEHYKSRYIQYPISVDDIVQKDFTPVNMHPVGTPVAVRPCSDNLENKTYLGIYLGEQAWTTSVGYNETTKVITIQPVPNPMMYVFKLKRVVFGAESWWSPLNSVDDFEQISDSDIKSTWYVQLLRGCCHNDDTLT